MDNEKNKDSQIDFKEEILKAFNKIKDFTIRTPIIKCNYLSKALNTNIWIKFENNQITGSFKLRGAANKLQILKEKGIKEIVTASSGNHGLAVAYMCKKLNIKGNIFIPSSCDLAKKEKIINYGGEYITLKIIDSKNSGEAEKTAIKFSKINKIPYISPYNDLDIICGQGTIGYEIAENLNLFSDSVNNQDKKIKFDEILVSAGGGGLISGISSYILIDDYCKNTKIIGVQPISSAVLFHSLKAGRVLDPEENEVKDEETISDGTAGGIDKETITIDLCKNNVFEWELIEESEIKNDLKEFIENEQQIIEGSSAITISAVKRRILNYIIDDRDLSKKNFLLVFCGRNISLEKLKKIII
jgi:threonine dehydratase